jgi:thioredoxin 1
VRRLQPPASVDGIALFGEALGIPRLVSLRAGACIPCKMMEPIREEIKKEYGGKMQVDFIDVWKNQQAGQT